MSVPAFNIRAKARQMKGKNGRAERGPFVVISLNFPVVRVAGYGKMCYTIFPTIEGRALDRLPQAPVGGQRPYE